jgi:hypothetical protein
MTICHKYIRAVSFPNDTCRRAPFVVSMTALIVACTILPPREFDQHTVTDIQENEVRAF